MDLLRIISGENDYRIFDLETQEVIIKGFASYEDAYIAYKRLLDIKKAFAQA
ncbi:MAG: hypothetical protein HQL71_12325 [Magnetococcales bacterium]|nr:hypothetical protein [Magnetococcales bacterium]